MTRAQNPEFTVDTGLFRQLGELLVGRDSTALVELIKNAYDADATTVLLRGEHLGDPRTAVLTVADDGTGMTEDQFRRGFLRLAARGKTEGERRSPIYRRRFTGEKGVGRLAAHKLAALLDVTTVAAVDANGLPLALELRSIDSQLEPTSMTELLEGAQHSLTICQLDWDLIESADTLSDVRDGLVLEAGMAGRGAGKGTTLVLSRLRHAWTSSDLRDLVRQVNNFQPPPSLAEPIPPNILPQMLLFQEPNVRDANRQDPGINLEFEGDFSNPEEYWGNVLKSAEWILEIRAERGKEVTYALSPTRVGRRSNQFSRALTATKPHPASDRGPFFDARILLRPGQVPTTETSWTQLNSGIRVYLEGFRVLPYGEPRNDWLSLDFDYTKRAGRFQIDPLLGSPSDDLDSLRRLASRDVSLRILPNRAFFGAVFLSDEGAGGLRTLVNREGFVPDDSYERLVDMVSAGIRLAHRARALANYNLKKYEEAIEAERQAAEEGSESSRENETPKDGAGDTGAPGGSDSHDATNGHGDEKTPGEEEAQDEGADDYGREWTVVGSDGAQRGSAARLQIALDELWAVLGLERDRHPLATTPEENVTLSVAQLYRAVKTVDDAAGALTEDTSLLRVLASVGSQLASFTHELSLLIPTAVSAEESLAPIPGTRWPPEAARARRELIELRRALERQASYLVDVATTEGRRRRSRQPLRERVDTAFLAFQGTAAAQDIDLINRVPENVRTPPLFRAEIQAVLSNLLSNAIKAAGANGRIEVLAEPLADGLRMTLENTGVAVRPEEAEEWFRPYASTTINVDPVLGQGMGLGLPITRDLIAEYGGTVRFVRPSEGFSTAIEVTIPD